MKSNILNSKSILAVAIVTATTVASVNVMASVKSANATVVVKNAFVITEDAPLDFGTIRATADPLAATVQDTPLGKISGLIMDPEDGTFSAGATASPATIASLGTGAPGEYSMTGVGAFKNFTLAAADGTLKTPGAAANAAFFTITDFTFFVTSITTPALYDGVTIFLKADAAGDASFQVGASIFTSATGETTAQTPYDDTTYAGTYDITVEYQ